MRRFFYVWSLRNVNRFRYFEPEELACRCGTCGMGEWDMSPTFMRKVVEMRTILNFAFVVTSAIRCPAYNDGLYVDLGHDPGLHLDGPHVTGHALDVAIYGYRAAKLLAKLAKHGITGIGLSQKGPRGDRFIHMDDLTNDTGQPRPWVWTY